jgi:methionyl aminopeptidase
MTIDTDDDLQALMRVGALVARTLRELRGLVRPGISTAELDLHGERMLQRSGARSAPRLVYGFPGALCLSVNDEAAHGIPGDRILVAGDLLKIDLTAELDGYMADAAITVGVGPVTPVRRKLVSSAASSLETALRAVTAGRRLREVGAAAETGVRKQGLTVVRELCGHGVGRTIHEEPHCVPSYFDPKATGLLHEGEVVAIEPHLTTGSGRIATAPDGWTLRTTDGRPVANFEHTVVVTKGKAIILTAA